MSFLVFPFSPQVNCVLYIDGWNVSSRAGTDQFQHSKIDPLKIIRKKFHGVWVRSGNGNFRVFGRNKASPHSCSGNLTGQFKHYFALTSLSFKTKLISL